MARGRTAGGRGLRITGGELGGRRLHSPPAGADVRPSTDRVREALFSMLGPLSGAALDLFCGSGALGLEALSRGAARARMVDVHSQLARRNVAELGLEGRCEVITADALEFLRRDRDRYDLVLCDPPYRLADRLGPELDKLLPDRLREGARVIVECSPERPLELELPLQRERRYGSTLLRIHEAPR